MTQNRNNLTKIQMWTDGSVDMNPGHCAGWGAILIYNECAPIRALSGFKESHHATNNQAESMALLGGLRALNRPCEVHLYTDSVYVIRGVNALRNNRVLTSNTEVWEAIQPFFEIHILKPHHVDGHKGAPFNEWADMLAGEAVEHRMGVDDYVSALPEAIQRRCEREAKKSERANKKA